MIIFRFFVCAIDNSSSNRSIHTEVALIIHTRNGLAFGKVISVQSVSIFELLISCKRLQLIVLRKYKTTPTPAFSVCLICLYV